MSATLTEIAEKKMFLFGTDDGRRFFTTAVDEMVAVTQVLERFPKNRSQDGPLSSLFKILEAPLGAVIEERLTTNCKVLK